MDLEYLRRIFFLKDEIIKKFEEKKNLSWLIISYYGKSYVAVINNINIG